ncbi:MAG: Mth938-like domain-containing protein [Rubrivivax sp.]|nr:Mth938-like domain-containing protein [Rubrivivax sp.]
MKFQPDTTAGVNLITRQEPGRVWVGAVPYGHSVLVPWQGEVLPWDAAAPEELTAAHFERLAAMQPELVIFGSGARLRFVAPALLQALMALRIGVETMDTPAACRTYNVLASEHRRVLAALLLAPTP